MIKLEEVRQAVISAVRSVHDSERPDLLVNYPNFTVVDIEHQKNPFVSVELSFDSTPRAALGEAEILCSGIVSLYYYRRDGRGLQGTYTYSDMLNENLAMRALGEIQYGDNNIITVRTFPGWAGEMNSINFDVSKGLSC